MPHAGDNDAETWRQTVIDELGVYPTEAFDFVEQGLRFAVLRIHGNEADPQADRHITGQQLCEGLREYALMQWGMMARLVLARWSITQTYDFGRIVFAMVEHGLMQKREEDSIEHFRNVYDFGQAFEGHYHIECKV